MPRQYIRHPAMIPIQLCVPHENFAKPQMGDIKDFSEGGLSCEAASELIPGEEVEVEIFINKPPFKAQGHVVWCQKRGKTYQVGIAFNDLETAYAVRMVEQVCHIEQYRNRVLKEEGRRLSSEEAAQEWISLHAAKFPSLQ